MATSTYNLIASQVVGSGGASSVTFGSGGTIPQTYTDLKVSFSARTNNSTGGAWDNIYITFNGNSSGYNQILAYGYDSGSTASASGSSGSQFTFVYAPRSAATANTFGSGELYIPNYTSSNQKSCSIDTVVENNSSSSYFLAMTAGLWTNTAAITSITITANSNSFVQYSTFYLYGIKNS